MRCDEVDLGIEVDEEFAVIDRQGNSSESLYAIGPLLKGRPVGDNGSARTPWPSDASRRDPAGA